MISFRNSKNKDSLRAVLVLIFFVFMVLSGCAGNAYTRPADSLHSDPVAEEHVSDARQIIPESEVFDLEPNIPGVNTTDKKQLAYMNYMLSTINISNGNYKEAIENLSKVIAYDPKSGYLKKRMALLLSEINNTDLA